MNFIWQHFHRTKRKTRHWDRGDGINHGMSVFHSCIPSPRWPKSLPPLAHRHEQRAGKPQRSWNAWVSQLNPYNSLKPKGFNIQILTNFQYKSLKFETQGLKVGSSGSPNHPNLCPAEAIRTATLIKDLKQLMKNRKLAPGPRQNEKNVE